MVKIINIDHQKKEKSKDVRMHLETDNFTPQIKEISEKIYGIDTEITYEDDGSKEIDTKLDREFKVKTRKNNGFTIRTFTRRKKPEYLGIFITVAAIICSCLYFFFAGQIEREELIKQAVITITVMVVLVLVNIRRNH